MSSAATLTVATDAKREQIRVMVVDDSVVIRGFISRWVDAESDMTIVSSVRTGLDAVNRVEQANPDVMILDIEMPDMDGITALPLLLKKRPGLVVIMASTLTRRNAEISFKALSLGAADYIPKPETARDTTQADTGFRNDLMQKIRSLARKHCSIKASTAPQRASVSSPSIVPSAKPVQKLSLRPVGNIAPRVLLIGSSTGGPQALQHVMPSLVPVIDRVPVLITQHMPPTFTTILAEHLARASGRVAREARDGEPVEAGRIYLAPGGFHMKVVKSGASVVIQLDDGPKVNFCKPAVDPLFFSALDIWHGGVTAAILTGMGSDGLHGSKALVAAGGNVIAQDEASSVVWGMPGAVANAGICCDVLPLNQISQRLVRLFAGDRT